MKTETEEKVNEVSKYIRDNFHHEKKCYFSSHINVITKSNGDKYNSLYCFYSPDEDDESMYGVALLWREDKEDGFMNILNSEKEQISSLNKFHHVIVVFFYHKQ